MFEKPVQISVIQTYWRSLFWVASNTPNQWIKHQILYLAFRDISHIGGSWMVEAIEDLNPRTPKPAGE